eukprot:scaffold7206_cov57-Phaeocystis_antarctica.AAC.4
MARAQAWAQARVSAWAQAWAQAWARAWIEVLLGTGRRAARSEQHLLRVVELAAHRHAAELLLFDRRRQLLSALDVREVRRTDELCERSHLAGHTLPAQLHERQLPIVPLHLPAAQVRDVAHQAGEEHDADDPGRG